MLGDVAREGQGHRRQRPSDHRGPDQGDGPTVHLAVSHFALPVSHYLTLVPKTLTYPNP